MNRDVACMKLRHGMGNDTCLWHHRVGHVHVDGAEIMRGLIVQRHGFWEFLQGTKRPTHSYVYVLTFGITNASLARQEFVAASHDCALPQFLSTMPRDGTMAKVRRDALRATAYHRAAAAAREREQLGSASCPSAHWVGTFLLASRFAVVNQAGSVFVAFDFAAIFLGIFNTSSWPLATGTFGKGTGGPSEEGEPPCKQHPSAPRPGCEVNLQMLL